MRKVFIIFPGLLYVCFGMAQSISDKTTIYFIPGQGSDSRIYNAIDISLEKYDTVKLNHLMPQRKESLQEFAFRYMENIDTSKPFILVGMSMGGMISTEIAHASNPEKVILISSAKCRDELPGRYKFMKYIPIYKIVPAFLYDWGAVLAQGIVEPDRKNNKETFKAMLKAKPKKFLKRTTGMIVTWDREDCDESYVHIHGDNDNTLPIKKVSYDYLVKDGSHMMTLTRGAETSLILEEILSVKR